MTVEKLHDADQIQRRRHREVRPPFSSPAIGEAHTSNELLDQACDNIATALERAFKQGVRDPLALEREMRNTTGKFIKDATGRRPMIVPVAMET